MADLYPLVFPLTYAALSGAEAIWPARRLPPVPNWRAIGVMLFLVAGFVNSTIPPLWQHFAAQARLFDLTSLGTGGAIVAVLVFEFANYFWHRARHRVPLLFRAHQMHHSAERIDVAGSSFGHPLDMLSVTAAGSFSASILGVTPEAAALAGFIGFVLATFQHANIKTPRWLGYFVQRPESHSIHHARGVHAYNYSNLPVFDIVFGTFRNPETAVAPSGFYDGASGRIVRMLVGMDVTEVDRDAPPAPTDATAPSAR